MKVTRDSALWTVGMVGSIAVGLSAGIGDHGPLAWMSEGAKHTILLVSMVTGMVSGYLKSSPAPLSSEGKANEQIQKLGAPPPPQTPPVLPPAAVLAFAIVLGAPMLAHAQVGTEPMAWQPQYRPIANGISNALVGVQAAGAVWQDVQTWRAGDRRPTWRSACSIGTSLLATESLKRMLPEARPDGSDNLSCCSGHSASTMALAGWNFTFGIPLSVATGFFRVNANEHHFWGPGRAKDVPVGWAIGAGAQALCSALIR